MSREVQLTQGYVALVDDEDYDRVVAAGPWHILNGSGDLIYAKHSLRSDGSNQALRLHRFILNAPAGQQVDHINGDGLDNRRSNLRLATQAQNNANRRSKDGSSSQYKGVCWNKTTGRWAATICLGNFDTEEQAARIYNKFAREVFGEFARLNLVDSSREVV